MDVNVDGGGSIADELGPVNSSIIVVGRFDAEGEQTGGLPSGEGAE